jgi:hypothetical protein
MKLRAVFLALCLSVSLPLKSQNSRPEFVLHRDSVRQGQIETDAIHIPDGTVVRLLVADSVSGKTAKANDPVQLRVIDEVKVGDLVVIANKAPALPIIAELRHAGRRSRPGTMSIKLDHVTLITGQSQELRGASKSKGNPGGGEWLQAGSGETSLSRTAFPWLLSTSLGVSGCPYSPGVFM